MRVILMATKSILNNVNIENNASARKLATALEQAESKCAEPVVRSMAYEYASKDDIQKMFGSKDE